MSYADAKQELMNTIIKNPAEYVLNQFTEGSVFHGEAGGLETYDLEDLPVTVRLENADNIYLTVTSWQLSCHHYRKLEYQARTGEDGARLPLPWGRTYVLHKESPRFYGESWELEQAIVGVAASEWREITVDILRHNPSAVYAWFFPCGLKPAMRRDGMALHVNNRPNSKEA